MTSSAEDNLVPDIEQYESYRKLITELQLNPQFRIKDRSEQLADALLKLLDDERSAVVLKHFHNWSLADIAQHLSRTQEAVAELLRQGLGKLRDDLREEN